MQIDAPEDPSSLDVRLVAADPLLVYDAEYPYEMRNENRVARFDIGASPPMPLAMELILPGNLAALAEVRVRWNKSFAEVSLSGSPFEIRPATVVSSSILLEGASGEP